MRQRTRLLIAIVLALGAAVALAVTLSRTESDAVLMDDVIVRDLSTVYPGPVAVTRDWFDGRLDERHTCADMRQSLRMFPPGFSAWSSPDARAALRNHVEDRC